MTELDRGGASRGRHGRVPDRRAGLPSASGATPRTRSSSPARWMRPLCIVGRDLGKDEVRAGQPLIGAAGRLVRAGILDGLATSPRPPDDPPAGDRRLRGGARATPC